MVILKIVKVLTYSKISLLSQMFQKMFLVYQTIRQMLRKMKNMGIIFIIVCNLLPHAAVVFSLKRNWKILILIMGMFETIHF